MCGIAGQVSTGRVAAHLVRRACDLLRHRGPDSAGFHTEQHCALGARRLAIIDVAGGDQPVYNEDRSVAAVFNGELYNFATLREDLIRRGHRLDTGGDTECLVHLYEEYGEDLVHRLRGMFAFAIWDGRRQRLLLARDRVGKKPLYWRHHAGSLVFGSELKAVLADPAAPRHLDPVALHHYLTYQYVPAPWSIYQGVRKLPPGHLLTWQAGSVAVRRYWRLDFTARPVTDPGAEADRLRELLLDAVRVRLVSERPLGVFLSGGIDSSAVVAAAAMQSTAPVRTFTVGFADRRFDEREYARAVANRYGTQHQELMVTGSTAALLPTLAWHFDEPFADSSAIPSFFVAELGRAQVTVVLGGDGGDECLGGYRRYALMGRIGRLPVPAPLRSVCWRAGGAAVTRSAPASRLRDAGRVLELLGLPPRQRYAHLMSAFTAGQKHALYTDELRTLVAGVDSHQLVHDAVDASAADSPVGRLIDADVHTYLPGDLLPKVDITTMANSIEARSPFLDHHLLEWAAGLPLDLKVRGGSTKHLLKAAVTGWLPDEVIHRPKKGFGVPMAAWLRRELREVAWDLLTDATACSRGLFRPAVVRALLREHDNGRDHATRIWTLLQFELWGRATASPEIDGVRAIARPATLP